MTRAIPTALVAGLALLMSGTLPAQTVDEIIARNLAARGGADRLRAIQTQRLVGRISFGDDPAMPFVVEIKRPGRIRNEILVDQQAIVRVIDGNSGWALNPLAGDSAPRPLTADELENLSGGADLEGPLLDYVAKGNLIELIGKDSVEGRPAWKLKVTRPGGEVRYDYVDAESWLETKRETTIRNAGKPQNVESYYRDYRPVNGVMISWLIASSTPGTAYTHKIVFDSVTVDQTIDDARFGLP
jgi:outer membrane lipoprotein-sorting protein